MDIFRILNVWKYTKRFKEDLKCNKVKKKETRSKHMYNL